MDGKLVQIPNYDKQNYSFYRLEELSLLFLFFKFILEVFSGTIPIGRVKVLKTVINLPWD